MTSPQIGVLLFETPDIIMMNLYLNFFFFKDTDEEEENVGGVRMTSNAVTSILFSDYPEKGNS